MGIKTKWLKFRERLSYLNIFATLRALDNNVSELEKLIRERKYPYGTDNLENMIIRCKELREIVGKEKAKLDNYPGIVLSTDSQTDLQKQLKNPAISHN